MPLGKNVHYAVKTTKSGKKVRLAFTGKRRGRGRVIEAKNLATGATHTPAEFAEERRRASRGPSARSVAGRAHLGRR